jgi:hydrogenase maturation protein HypF
VALEWNLVADEDEAGEYAFDLDRGADPVQVDLRPMVREAVGDLLSGVGAPTVSARFHNTLAAVAASMVREVAGRDGRRPVVLTGGCFQNERLVAEVRRRLEATHQVWQHLDVPPGDGGLALGQALVADAVDRA